MKIAPDNQARAITDREARQLVPGAVMDIEFGGLPGDWAENRYLLRVEVVSVGADPRSEVLISGHPDFVVRVRDVEDHPEDGYSHDYQLYVWEGYLRVGANADVVRRIPGLRGGVGAQGGGRA